MKKWTSVFILIVLTLTTVACVNEESLPPNANATVSKTEFMLDTVVTIKLYGTDDETLIAPVFARGKELEKLLSAYIIDSDVSHINANAGKEPITVSEKTYYLINKSISYAESSSGLFDITIGPLIDLWAIDPPTGHVPTKEELAVVLPLIDYTKIQLDEGNFSVLLPDENMMINLGAIAKGFIVDEMVQEMNELGIKSAIINAGGNIYALGGKSDGSHFNIAIQDPDSDRGEYLGVLATSNKSVVTSGDYERFFIEEGVKYHHILDPYTGYPVTNEIKSVSIVSDNSTDGDALSTTTLLLGLEEGKAFIEKLDGVDAIFVTRDNEIYMTGQLASDFELTNTSYKIIE
ncbi:FAD:protein FMN transferase [Vallitalea okinawensis]|uniref:FAD:protein FMN transferase n=1 Tax=Vallitalea okinawensis TaxID=2078660 RepID=UPI000CFB9FE0|nr:FAD:protein FMN transferase [Vallitalea okinawensis]